MKSRDRSAPTHQSVMQEPHAALAEWTWKNNGPLKIQSRSKEPWLWSHAAGGWLVGRNRFIAPIGRAAYPFGSGASGAAKRRNKAIAPYAHFWSFNFTNPLICPVASSARVALKAACA